MKWRRFLSICLWTWIGTWGCSGSSIPARPGTVAGRASEEARRQERKPLSLPPEGRLPPGITPLRYALELEVDPRKTGFGGQVDIRIRLEHAVRHIWLHAAGMQVEELFVVPGFEGDFQDRVLSSRPGFAINADWEATPGTELVAIHFPVLVGPGEATLHIRYRAPFDTQLQGLYRVEAGGQSYAFTQFEPTMARRAFPCFDEPRFKTPFSVSLKIKSTDRAFSNGPEADIDQIDEESIIVRFARTPPLPTYLVAFAVGPFDVVEWGLIPPNRVRAHSVPLRGIAPQGRSKEMGFALGQASRLLSTLEERIGVPYPFEKLDLVAVPDFASGAMENPGLITFRDTFLLLPERPGVDKIRATTSVIAHELAHQWFGNLVTMPWWDELWLNEAFATFLAFRAVARVAPEQNALMQEAISMHQAMDADSLPSARRVRQSIASEHDIRNAFDAITYQKGAALLGMLEAHLGEDAFWKGIKDFLEAHRFGSARTEDVYLSLSRAAGVDVASRLLPYLDQAGVPLLQVDLVCGEAGGVIELRQRPFMPLGVEFDPSALNSRWTIPVCLRFGRRGGEEEACMLLRDFGMRFAVPPGPCPEWVHPNAGAIAYYRFALPAQEFNALGLWGYDRLNARERLLLAHALEGMVRLGAQELEDILPFLERVANDPERVVSTAPFGLFRQMVEHWAQGDARARRWVASLYGTRLARLTWNSKPGETQEDTLFRRDLAWFLIRVARDERVIAQAAELGRNYLGKGQPPYHDGRLHPEALPPELVAPALQALFIRPEPCAAGQACADDPGSAQRALLFEHALNLALASEDGAIRQRLLFAIASVEEEGLRERVLGLALDPRLRVNEREIPIAAQASGSSGRRFVLEWVGAHLQEIGRSFARVRLGNLPLLFSDFCAPTDLEHLKTVFRPVTDSWPGIPRNLALASEAIAMCAALRERYAEPFGRLLPFLGQGRQKLKGGSNDRKSRQ
ncbi:MAG: M1 family metallopeptidase [Sandaracinaceae bacterium]|nr:M1 family metallopeptidase [Sandaracinaceae bacterium]